MRPIPVPTGREATKWATDLVGVLRDLVLEVETPAPKIIQLQTLTARATSAAQDGLMLWDAENGAVVVSKGGQWYDITMTLKP